MRKILLLLASSLIGWALVADEVGENFNNQDSDYSFQSFPTKPKIEYVSKIFSDEMFLDNNGRCDQPMVVDKSSAIYRITISGVPFNEGDLFEKGMNGFRYEINVVGGSNEYDAKAYPLCGAEYKEGMNSVSLIPRDISFLWKGPFEDGSQEKEVKITQKAHNFRNNTDVTIASTIINMPMPGKDPEGKYEIILEPAGEIIQTYRNGVCAAPFKVILKQDSKVVKDKGIYNSLFFCQRSQAGGTMPMVVGADPGDKYQNAILPSDKVEVKDKKPIYHLGDPIVNYDEGKVFYLFSGHNNTANIKIDVCLMHKSGTELTAQSLSIRTIPQDIQVGMSGEQNSNVAFRDIGFIDGSEISVPAKGFLDFVFTDEQREKLSFIIPLLPEGLNERDLSKRYNFSAFKAGFYLIPPDNYEREKVSKLKVTDRTATLSNTWDKDIYAYIFDIHGRHNMGMLFHDNKIIYTQEGKLIWVKNEYPIRSNLICRQNNGESTHDRLIEGITNYFTIPKLILLHDYWDKYPSSMYDTTYIVGPSLGADRILVAKPSMGEDVVWESALHATNLSGILDIERSEHVDLWVKSNNGDGGFDAKVTSNVTPGRSCYFQGGINVEAVDNNGDDVNYLVMLEFTIAPCLRFEHEEKECQYHDIDHIFLMSTMSNLKLHVLWHEHNGTEWIYTNP